MVETVVTVEHTTTTTTANDGGGLRAIKIHMEFLHSVPGILKIIQFIIGLLCMFFGSPVTTSGSTFFMLVVFMAWLATLLWIAAYFLGLREIVPIAINWILTELVNTGLITLFYFVGDLLQFVSLTGRTTTFHIIAAVLGLFNVLAYGAGTYFLFLAHKNGVTI